MASSKDKSFLELSLDFSNTVDWRNGAKREDGLTDFASLVQWSVRNGTIGKGDAPSFLANAAKQHSEERIFQRAVLLREAIYRVFSAVAHEHHPATSDLEELNRFLSEYPVSSTVVRKGEGYAWSTVAGKDPEGRMLWPIAKSAADLLTSDQLVKVTECANEEEGCGWVFIDKTKSGTKRWCSSSGCGNRAKVRAWYERHEKPLPKAA